MMGQADGFGGGRPRNTDVLLRRGQVTPLHDCLKRDGRYASIGMEARCSRPKTMRIHPTTEFSVFNGFLDSSVHRRTGLGKCIVSVSELFDTEFDAERDVEGDNTRRSDGLRMPAAGQSFSQTQYIAVLGLTARLSATIPTAARFVVWNPYQFPIPIHPISCEVGNFPGSKAEATGQQANQPGFKPPRFRKSFTRFQQSLELPIRERVLVCVCRQVSLLRCLSAQSTVSNGFELIGSYRHRPLGPK